MTKKKKIQLNPKFRILRLRQKLPIFVEPKPYSNYNPVKGTISHSRVHFTVSRFICVYVYVFCDYFFRTAYDTVTRWGGPGDIEASFSALTPLAGLFYITLH